VHRPDPVRHLFVTQDYPPDLGGMARRHVELCRRFPHGAVAVSTVAAPSPAGESFDRGEHYPILRQPFPFGAAKLFTNQVRWGAAIARECREGAWVLHLGNIRPCGYAVALATRRRPLPYLVYVNGGDLLRERVKVGASWLKRRSARDILGRAAGVVANSAWTAGLTRDVMQQVGVSQAPAVAAIDLGTDPQQFSPARDRRALRQRLGIGDAPLLLTVARLVPHKGQDVAVRALAALPPTANGAAHYLVVGEGVDAGRLAGLAQSLGVGERVHLAGVLDDEAVAEAYATADVYVGLSRVDQEVNAEGFGISFVEAAASGTPSVAGDSGGVRSAVRDGETGFVVPPTDLARVVREIGRLLDDDALRARMGAAGRRAVETHYNWDRVARETLDFTQHCLHTTR